MAPVSWLGCTDSEYPFFVEPQVLERLNRTIEEIFSEGHGSPNREKASRRIRMTLDGIARKSLDISAVVETFGSYSNGFKTGTSDLDIVLRGKISTEKTVPLLQKFADTVPEYGYTNVTRIFQANVPLVKFTDKRSGMEVDFCINNELGVRNSLLLLTYCKLDIRMMQVGRLVKEWAKRHELVGTADGYLNSYAYMLLTIHYMQSLDPPVVPNLQELATTPRHVYVDKWGSEDRWETKFFEDWESLPKSENKQTVGELVMGFFKFFVDFDWRTQAVCMRLNKPGAVIDKFQLKTVTNEEQWYVEDPFDLKHNLAGKCSRAGRKRMLDEMMKAYQSLREHGNWSLVCPPGGPSSFYLKCRISEKVSPQDLLEEFADFQLTRLHFPKLDSRSHMGQAFLEFSDIAARRRAHVKNETYKSDVRLHLHYSSQHGLAEAVSQGSYSTYEMDSYKMQRRVLSARVSRTHAYPEPFMGQVQHMSHMPQHMYPGDGGQFYGYGGLPFPRAGGDHSAVQQGGLGGTGVVAGHVMGPAPAGRVAQPPPSQGLSDVITGCGGFDHHQVSSQEDDWFANTAERYQYQYHPPQNKSDFDSFNQANLQDDSGSAVARGQARFDGANEEETESAVAGWGVTLTHRGTRGGKHRINGTTPEVQSGGCQEEHDAGIDIVDSGLPSSVRLRAVTNDDGARIQQNGGWITVNFLNAISGEDAPRFLQDKDKAVIRGIGRFLRTCGTYKGMPLGTTAKINEGLFRDGQQAMSPQAWESVARFKHWAEKKFPQQVM
eukprot:TRINITY_DN61525_c0_g1_i1.p1 TRINITY_DN61525_c0_g1~~TRINITY_DN61525_c0_g1_i1.p1  ORF type:complete len:790 (+),score=92.44 TRINITY_DN61525_c0_g1_i1:46-2370(+)